MHKSVDNSQAFSSQRFKNVKCLHRNSNNNVKLSMPRLNSHDKRVDYKVKH